MVWLGATLALATGITAICFYAGDRVTRQADAALNAKDLAAASRLYNKAAHLDPWQAANQINLAQIAALESGQNQNGAAYNEALAHARRATELEPYNPNVQGTLLKTYGLLGRNDLQMQAAQATIKANPFLSEPYRILAQLAMQAAWSNLDKGQLPEAKQSFRLVLAMRQKMPDGIAKKNPALNMAAGQSALLLGEMDLARKYLEMAGQGSQPYASNAKVWLGSVDYMASLNPANAAGRGEQEIDLNALLVYLNQHMPRERQD